MLKNTTLATFDSILNQALADNGIAFPFAKNVIHISRSAAD